ncbi:MAG TPA: hypothetical protein VFR05_11600 [Terriglobia bacterium]|nr:hypothetical protein [Terriglobia bacterium]
MAEGRGGSMKGDVKRNTSPKTGHPSKVLSWQPAPLPVVTVVLSAPPRDSIISPQRRHRLETEKLTVVVNADHGSI